MDSKEDLMHTTVNFGIGNLIFLDIYLLPLVSIVIWLLLLLPVSVVNCVSALADLLLCCMLLLFLWLVFLALMLDLQFLLLLIAACAILLAVAGAALYFTCCCCYGVRQLYYCSS